MSRLVQSGPREAKIVVVGEAPGAKEDTAGIPFCGPSGTDEHCGLNTLLGNIGHPRDTVFVTNVVHERPPGNDFNHFLKPKPKLALLQGILQLKTDIEAIRPNLVIALGDVPLRFLTNKHGIGKWRGSILESTLVKGQKVLGTYHPASVFRVWENLALLRFDMERAKEEARSPEISLPQRDLLIFDGSAEHLAVVEEMYHAEWLSVDIECTLRDNGSWDLSCVGFSDRPDRALTVPRGAPGFLDIVKRLCASPAKKVGQNFCQFDWTVLEDNNVPVTNVAWDTMFAHHALMMEAAGGEDEVKKLRGGKASINPLKKGLGFQVSIYTREPYYKDDGKLWRTPDNITEFYRYNGKDAACTGEIRNVQEKELNDFGVRQVFDFEMKMIPLLRRMSRRGVRIDMEARQQLFKRITGEAVNLQAFVDGQAGGQLNVKSAPAMQKFLYETLKLPVQYKKRKDGQKTPTADKDALIELAAKHGHPVLMAMLEVRKRRDLIERYLSSGVDADGRMRCLFDPTGTRTGRLASRSNIYGSGTNLQNIPEVLRRMFVADVGKVLFYIDLSQAEARVVAWLARCESLIELFSSGRDIHKENAIRFFGEYTEAKRVAVKRIVHGSNYGEGPDKIVIVAAQDGIKLLRHDVVLGQQAYFMLYPEIKENWWAEVREALRYDRTLITPLGWKRQFFGRWDNDKFLFQAYSFQPQGTVGILAQMGMLNTNVNVPDAEILLNEHDAIVGQCDEDKAETVVPAVVNAMQIPIQIHGRELIIPADAKVGRNWGSASDENPDGLKKWKVA